MNGVVFFWGGARCVQRTKNPHKTLKNRFMGIILPTPNPATH